MSAHHRLKGLSVDDEEPIRRLIAAALGNVDIDVSVAIQNAEAIRVLQQIATFHLELDIITTDIVREYQTSGIDLVRRIRNLPDEVTKAGGLRLRHTPIVVISGNADRPEFINELTEIDRDIPRLMKPFNIEELIKTVDDAVCDYRSKVLEELHHIGMAFVWQDGQYNVVNAFALRPSSDIENKYFAGRPDALGKSYSRLVLISDRWQRAGIALREFESLLNYPDTTEREFQRFFELHPEFLLGDHYASYWAEPVLESPETKRKIRPDFILQPRTLQNSSWNWALLDLKGPQLALITHTRFHTDLSHHVYRVATQLRDYSDFFADPRNYEVIRGRFGGIVPRPKLVAIIGRLPIEHRDHYAVLRSRVTGVTITTYDEVLEFRRAKVEWAKSMGI